MKLDLSTSLVVSEELEKVLNRREDLGVSGPMTSTSTRIKSISETSEKKTTMQVTLSESMQGISPTSTSFVQDFHARRFRLLEKGEVSRTLVARFSSRYAELLKIKALACYSWRMLKDLSTMKKGEPSPRYWAGWKNWGTGGNTGFLTANISEYLSDGRESLLSDIIEDTIPDEFFLSEKMTRYLLETRKRKPHRL